MGGSVKSSWMKKRYKQNLKQITRQRGSFIASVTTNNQWNWPRKLLFMFVTFKTSFCKTQKMCESVGDVDDFAKKKKLNWQISQNFPKHSISVLKYVCPSYVISYHLIKKIYDQSTVLNYDWKNWLDQSQLFCFLSTCYGAFEHFAINSRWSQCIQ